MDIPQLWKLYSSSEKRVPEFDTALAGLAKELRVSPEKAFGVFIQIIGTPEMSSAVRASVSFPLIKMANDALEEATNRALKLLRDIEKADISSGSPDLDAAKKTISAAEAEIKAMLESGNVVDKQGLHSAFTDHKTVFTRSKVLERLENHSGLLNLSKKTFDEIGGVYAAGDWKAVPTKTTINRMLASAAAGEKHALEDFVAMSKTKPGRELLGTIEESVYELRLSDIAKRIEQTNMPRINVKGLLKTQKLSARFLVEEAARRAEPKRLYNILSDIVGSSRPAAERARATGRALEWAKDLAFKYPKLSIALALGGVAAAIVDKMTDFFGGGDKAKPGSDSATTDSKSSEKDSSASPASTDSASASSGAALQGDIADRVAARLRQVYSGGKK